MSRIWLLCTITLSEPSGAAGIAVPQHVPCSSSDGDDLGWETDALFATRNEVGRIHISL